MEEDTMSNALAIPTALALALTAPPTLAVTLAQSSFDLDADGWTALTLNDASDSWSLLSSGLAVGFTSSDGMPPGAITFHDPDNGWSYFSAPAKFLGNQGAALGGELRFHTRTVNRSGVTGPADEADVVLRGAGLTLAANLLDPAPDAWTPVTVSLSAGAWRVSNTFSGAYASEAQIAAVLADLDALWINAEHFTPVVETIGLDSVLLTSPIPEPGILAMLLGGLGVLTLRCRRRRGND
jgi:hypothetical protein